MGSLWPFFSFLPIVFPFKSTRNDCSDSYSYVPNEMLGIWLECSSRNQRKGSLTQQKGFDYCLILISSFPFRKCGPFTQCLTEALTLYTLVCSSWCVCRSIPSPFQSTYPAFFLRKIGGRTTDSSGNTTGTTVSSQSWLSSLFELPIQFSRFRVHFQSKPESSDSPSVSFSFTSFPPRIMLFTTDKPISSVKGVNLKD